MASLLLKPFNSSLRLLTLQRLTRSLTNAPDEKKCEDLLDKKPIFIHPTAVVHPGAILGQGVSIGPFCTVGSYAKVGNACQLYPGSHIFGDTELGDNCTVLTGAIVGEDLPGRTTIGCNNIIGHHAVIGVKCQDMKYKDYTHTAGAIVVHQFCHIGSFSFIGGGSVVSQDVPRYMMVSGERAELRGLNLEGLRRCGFSAEEIKSMRKAYQKIFIPKDAKLGGIEDRLKELEHNEELSSFPVIRSMVQSIRDSFDETRRGICKFRHWSGS
uniref:UDP N-acetylglucosamine O-acyltransferase C-terminal domain-containing protein n=1 Tax=Nelumbo nucifera TaxID=4432 RepID=A0A822ZHV1_NELNU|nr:TPA_asm: hypothetical protein HUJ06_002687 [Nelumbo nucifera]